MMKRALDFSDWLLMDIKRYQFWRRGEQNFAVGIIFADMATFPGFGEHSNAAKIAEKIADETQSDRLTMWLLKRSSARYTRQSI